ncbi:MAG TPA: hypothetical protein VFN67_17705 [Polyangiales bacterium]|nr:hypothetical protein [Polyangiales bacterium]
MLGFCTRLLTFQRALIAAQACLSLMAAAGCKQDWSVPGTSQSQDAGVVMDSGASPRDAGAKNDPDMAIVREEQKPGQPASGGNAPAGASGTGGQSVGGKAGVAGSGGSSGSGGKPAAESDSGAPIDVPKPDPCTTQGMLRCMGAGGQREICDKGVFRAADACLADEVCDEQGECVKVAAICQGSAGKSVCDGQGGLVSCNANGSVRAQESCMSQRHCQVGLSTGVCPKCIPDEYRCTGVNLERCEADGQSFETAMVCDSAALCKAESGACTDAACASGAYKCSNNVLTRCNSDQTAFEMVKSCPAGLCDAMSGDCLECSPGSRSCEKDTDTALICDGTGKNLARNACVAPRSHCVGAGQCVQCAVDVPCAQSTQVCRTSSCNLRTGSCEDTRVAAGTGCSVSGQSGVCDSAGACVECLMEGDGRCAGSKPHCTSAHKCERCTVDDHCAFDEKCVNADCIKKCGDGVLDPGEDCERGYLNSSASNCDFATCKRTNYINCRDTAVMCPMGTFCIAAFYCLPTSDMNCVTSCPEVPGMRTGCRQGICFLDCSAAEGGKCPSDMHCEHASADGTSELVDMCFGNQ